MRILGDFAGRGYITVASQYRGASGGEGQDEFGGRDVNDVLSLLPLVDSLPDADPRRIGMVGHSRGGMMTYLALTHTDRIRAAVVLSGASDLTRDLQVRPEMLRVYRRLITNDSARLIAELRARSVRYFADRLSPHTPILILHGSADQRVEPDEALELARALLRAGRTFRLVLFEGGDHSISEHHEEVQGLMFSWLDRYVRDAP